jgi:hypothetical protein
LFDGRFFDELAFLSGLRRISVLAANGSIDEFEIPETGFPISVRDQEAQTALIDRFLSSELNYADLVMVPELAGTEDGLIAAIAAVEKAGGNRVALAGTRHMNRDGRQVNLASLVLPTGEVVDTCKRTPFWDVDIRESIAACPDPIRILVSADVRVAVLVCKDFLTPAILNLIAHAGANLILVPSMSRRLDLHDVAARQLAAQDHALSVVGNGPLRIGDSDPETVLVGLPEADPTLTVIAHRASAQGLVVRLDLNDRTFSEQSLK